MKYAFVQNQQFPNKFAFGIYVAESVKATAKIGYQSFLIYPNLDGKKDVKNYYHLNDSKISSTPIDTVILPTRIPILSQLLRPVRHIVRSWTFAYRALKVVKKHNISLVQTTCREFIILSRFSTHHHTIVYDVHVEPRIVYEKILDSLARPRVDALITNSRYYAKYYVERGIKSDKILLAPSGYNQKQFKSVSPSQKKALRNKYNLPQDQWIISFIGRFEILGQEKGIPSLLKAIKITSNNTIHFLAAGGPSALVEKYQKHAKALNIQDQVTIMDHVSPSEAAELVKLSDCTAALYPPNHHFTDKMFPQKIIESMAADVPVITNSLPAITQWVDSANVILVKTIHPKDIASTISDTKKHHKQTGKITSKARKWAKQWEWRPRQQKIIDFAQNHSKASS